MLVSFVEMFRGHREEAAETIGELVRRVVDGDAIPPAVLFKAATEAGMTADDVDAMADRMRHRDQLRVKAMDADGAYAEVAKLTDAIGRHDAALADAERRHAIAVAPLLEQLTAAQTRHAEATQSETDLLNPKWLDPPMATRLREAQAEYHAASETVTALEREHHEQIRRGEFAERELIDAGQDPAKLEKLWRDESTRHLISNAAERVFLDWLRGNARAKEAAEKLPPARRALEAAKHRLEETQTEARAS